MAETKPVTSENVERKLQTPAEAVKAMANPPPPDPSQEEADAIKLGTHGEETAAVRRKREAKATTEDTATAGYKTR